MATMEEEVTDLLWEEMKIFATEQQQCLYELLPECTVYKSNERKYLRQNIGYAIYGPPNSTKDDPSATEDDSSCYGKTENPNDTDVADTVGYNEKAEKVIDKIYDQICEYGTVESDDSRPIYFSTIYNIIFRPKMNVQPEKKVEKEAKKEIKKKVKEEAKKETEAELKEKAKEDEKNQVNAILVPIFKIRKMIQKESDATKSAEQKNTSTNVAQYETWYIDLNGRIYKTWEDYKNNNTLPKCTMVLPKDGFYQPNLSYPVTEDYSTVLLEIMESPACGWTSILCTGIDIASSVVGLGAAGLGVASMFTPLAPVVIISSLAVAGASSVWSLGRNSQQLVDRSSHEESINPLDKEAFPHYLGLVGTAFGLGAIGGSAIISNVAARGMTVNAFTRVAFNTVQGGNLVLNGVGVLYQSYYMIDKYLTDKTVDPVDVLNLATHLMFFCGSVVKVQFASDIIESTQGRVMNDYKEGLITKRLRKKYNRVVRNAAENNMSKISKNAEVIRYIRNRQQIMSNQSATQGGSQILDNTSLNSVLSWEGGKLRVNGIVLLDPIDYVICLIKLGVFIETDQNNSSGSRNNANDTIANDLRTTFCDLLSKFYASDDCPRSTKLPLMPEFEPLIKEMSVMNINKDSLEKLFKIAVKLMKRSRNMDDFLFQMFTFVWQYCTANLKQWGMSYCTQSISGNNILRRIIAAVFEAIDMVLNNLYDAFAMYMDANLNR